MHSSNNKSSTNPSTSPSTNASKGKSKEPDKAKFGNIKSDYVKLRAKKLRSVMVELGHSLNHSETLEVVARLEGYSNWNTYVAALKQSESLLPLPSGWMVSGDSVELYEYGLDTGCLYQGKAAASIRSKENTEDKEKSMATVMQTVDATNYRNKRVTVSAHLKAHGVKGAVTLWFRVDGGGPGRSLAFDNLETAKVDGVLDGTTEWEERSITFDIPDNADSLNFGFFLRGAGVGYAAAFSVKDVGKEIPVTKSSPNWGPEPKNLDFDEAS